MRLELRIDYEGNPYIECFESGEELEDDLMEIFIRKAKKEGLIIVNENSITTIGNYISIRLAKSSNKPINLETVKPKVG
jgi:hypothetical protein